MTMGLSKSMDSGLGVSLPTAEEWLQSRLVEDKRANSTSLVLNDNPANVLTGPPLNL